MMSAPRVVLHPEVPEDLLAIIEYLAARSPEAADRFERALPGALADITRFPGAGSLRIFKDPRLAGIRTWRVPKFKKYLIFYRPIEDGINVLAVLHGARDVEAALHSRG